MTGKVRRVTKAHWATTMQKTFGQELRRLRGEAKLTMAALADEMGWSIVYVSDIERSRRNPPSAPDILKLLRRMGKEEHAAYMQRLAAESRKTIEIQVKSSDDSEVNDMLVALARQADEGLLDGAIAKKIRQLLEESRDNS